MTNPNYDKLVKKLNELFMLDQADLDFGIYRIMNFRRDEIRQFIERELLTQVRAELDRSGGVDRKATQQKLEAAIKQAQELGVDPESTPAVKGLRSELAEAGNAEAQENEVFSQLYNFFSRYYEGGDFISLRRYKKDVYAIPYEGEEVKLHWANADQYYVKSSEFFKNYRFTLADGKSVEFSLREATTEQNNNKSTGNTERRFRLAPENPVETDGNTFRIWFHYEAVEKSVKQDELLQRAIETLVPLVPKDFIEVLAKRPTDKNKTRTLLEKHLRDYTARHSFDYFIHKDLGAFLRRELDFFIKNELLDIDEVDTQADAMQHMTSQFAKIVALKKIARKIIAFLASLENFQRNLWLKKKFVIDAQYCLTLDRVPSELYPEIAANTAQTDEWVDLFKIDQLENDLIRKTPFSRPLSVSFLGENLHLVLDTRHFSPAFKLRLLAAIPNLDEQNDGLLLHSDNFQALAFLQERYREQVKCVYIDPPYNTAASEIVYKNEYKNSSWMSLIQDRISSAKCLLTDNGILCATIDDCQQKELHSILESNFEAGGLAGTVVIRCNPSGRPTQTGFALAHEYAIFARKTEQGIIERIERSEEQAARFDQIDENGVFELRNLRREGSNSERERRRRLYYPIFITETDFRIPKMDWEEETENWILLEENNLNEQIIYPIDEKGIERTWRWSNEKVKSDSFQVVVKKPKGGKLGVYCKYRPNEDGAVTSTIWTDAKYSATEYGTAVLKKLFQKPLFSYPKSIFAVEDCIKIMGLRKPEGIALDYFAGSGTTGHAVININREDNGQRKYILVEQGEYFDTVLLPRLKKVVYAKDWKNGAPQNHDTGVSHCIKYLRLESYEDTLNNLTLTRSDNQTLAFEGAAEFRETYMLHYLFEAESRAALGGTETFAQPFTQRLRLVRPEGEREAVVDMVETFNYLLGLVVETTYEADGFRVVTGRTLPDASGRTQNTLIVWRNCAEKTAEDLNAFFAKQKFSPRDREFDKIYVNGDHTLQNVLDEHQSPKVVLIEGEFRKRMFGA